MKSTSLTACPIRELVYIRSSDGESNTIGLPTIMAAGDPTADSGGRSLSALKEISTYVGYKVWD